MGLSHEDIEQIERAVLVAIKPLKESMERLEDKVEALRNRIKEIYDMIAGLQKAQYMSADFEKQVLKAYRDIVALAKQSGVVLPKE